MLVDWFMHASMKTVAFTTASAINQPVMVARTCRNHCSSQWKAPHAQEVETQLNPLAVLAALIQIIVKNLKENEMCLPPNWWRFVSGYLVLWGGRVFLSAAPLTTTIAKQADVLEKHQNVASQICATVFHSDLIFQYQHSITRYNWNAYTWLHRSKVSCLLMWEAQMSFLKTRGIWSLNLLI